MTGNKKIVSGLPPFAYPLLRHVDERYVYPLWGYFLDITCKLHRTFWWAWFGFGSNGSYSQFIVKPSLCFWTIFLQDHGLLPVPVPRETGLAVLAPRSELHFLENGSDGSGLVPVWFLCHSGQTRLPSPLPGALGCDPHSHWMCAPTQPGRSGVPPGTQRCAEIHRSEKTFQMRTVASRLLTVLQKDSWKQLLRLLPVIRNHRFDK